MRVFSFSVFIFVAIPPIFAQRAEMTPLGAVITPHASIRISAGLRAALPRHTAIRLVQPTVLSEGGEDVVIYEKGNPYEPYSHIAVVKNGHRVADFGLATLFHKDGSGSGYEFFKASVVETSAQKSIFVAAFRNIGDGSRTLFVLLIKHGGRYEVAGKYATQEGRVKVLRSGKIQVWGAGDDGECNWCPQHYGVITYEWTDAGFSRAGYFKTRNSLSPEDIANNPIVVEK